MGGPLPAWPAAGVYLLTYLNVNPEYPNIEVISEGCNDVVRSEGCGLAYIYVDGEQKAPQKRGHNFVVISALTGKGLNHRRSSLDNSVPICKCQVTFKILSLFIFLDIDCFCIQ